MTKINWKKEYANLKEELENEIEGLKKSKDCAWKEAHKLEKEIEQIHQVLDALPNYVSRKSSAEEEWARVERSALTRLAAWLGGR